MSNKKQLRNKLATEFLKSAAKLLDNDKYSMTDIHEIICNTLASLMSNHLINVFAITKN